MEHLHDWSNRMQGARQMLVKLYDEEGMLLFVTGKKSDDRVYTRAIVNLVKSDLKNVETYLMGANIGFRKHVRSQKGKLVSCEAYFID